MDPLRHILLAELNDKGIASGLCKSGGEWIVFDLAGAPETTLPGHVLTGEFHAEAGAFFPVLNIDTGDTMTSRVFKHGLTLSEARGEIDWLGTPAKITYIQTESNDATLYTRLPGKSALRPHTAAVQTIAPD